MDLIDKIRKKPQEEKVRIIWAVIIIAVILLVVLWVFTSKISESSPKDTTLFKTMDQGIKDIRDNYKK